MGYGPDDDGLEAAWDRERRADAIAQLAALGDTPLPTGDGGDEAE